MVAQAPEHEDYWLDLLGAYEELCDALTRKGESMRITAAKAIFDAEEIGGAKVSGGRCR